jgi:hypothetical protein
MKITQTPDGIPVITLSADDLAGPEPAGFTAAMDQLAEATIERLLTPPQ